MMNHKLVYLFAWWLLWSQSTESKVKLAAVFDDNMVLQQQQQALPIWGTASPNKTIYIVTSWNKKKYAVSSDATGKWKGMISTPAADNLSHTITFNDGSETMLKNILIGEVWICGGQSNMEMPMKGFIGQPLQEGVNFDIMRSTNQRIRIFTVAHDTTLIKRENIGGTWESASPSTICNFSATAYYFGRLLQETLNVPVGLMAIHWGGASIESWMSKEMLSEFVNIHIPLAFKADRMAPQRTPTLIYNTMLYPVIGVKMKGMIWYQGEANVERFKQYPDLFNKFITSIRREWNAGDFPFYYCQIAPYQHYRFNSAFLREAQLKVETLIPNVGMAVLMDAGQQQSIHPMKKKIAGERLALQALTRTYAMGEAESQSPIYSGMQIRNDTIILSFDRASLGLTSHYKPLKSFTIAGEDQEFYPAKAWIRYNKVYVVAETVKKPVAVRYAFVNNVEGELYSVEGLPVSSFRTDCFEK